MDNERTLEQEVQQEQVIQEEFNNEAQEAPQEAPEAQAQPQADEKERNFAALREARERAERERDEALNYIRQLQQQSQPQQAEDEDLNLAPDDLVEWKHVDKKIKKLENKLHQYENQTNLQVTENRLKSQFNDFDQVVTKENVEALRMAYPEIAASLHATPDIYNKAVSTYNIIKQFGIGQVNPMQALDKQTIQKNMSKPRMANSISPQQGDSPLNRANEFANGSLSDERKAQLYKEMMQARNNW